MTQRLTLRISFYRMYNGRKAYLVFRKQGVNFRIAVRNPLPFIGDLQQLARSAEAGGRIDFSCELDGCRGNAWRFAVMLVNDAVDLRLEPVVGNEGMAGKRFEWGGGPAVFTAAIYYLTNAMKG
ncbi:hypothetical protein [Pedobacter sp. JY14-1]|uniref:hypothetical protein n=1 Tax=Pedobacter sp. JY14-1 TaxID=3034151 RepID=UPI0023E0BD85|nr:hypothetical protein [Pedobacter sp. JY14-1]